MILLLSCTSERVQAPVDTGCVPGTVWPDLDGDGWGDTLRAAESCVVPSGYVATAGDCDDAQAQVNPEGVETCDSTDEDCDGVIDEDAGQAWYADADGDGHGDPGVVTWSCTAAGVATADDCDDTCAACWSDALEVCSDGLDNDCDGVAPDCGLDAEVGAALAYAKFVGIAESYAGYRVLGLGNGDAAVVALQEEDGAGAVYVVAGDTSGPEPLAAGRARITDVSTRYLGWHGLAVLDGPALVLAGASSLGAPVHVLDATLEGEIDAVVSARATLTSWSYPVPWGSVATGDLDGDGVEDVTVSGVGEEGDGGLVWVVPGDAEGAVDLSALDGTVSAAAGTQTHWRLTVAGDADGDGLDDLLLGVSYESAVYVALGPLEPMDIADAWGRLSSETWDVGTVSAAPGDLDGDGLDDLLLGDPGRYDDDALGSGRAWMVCGPTGGEMALEDATAVLLGEGAYHYAGYALAGAGDSDADGGLEVLVGAPGAGTVFLAPGDVTGVWGLGAVATTRFTAEGVGDSFGAAVAGIGDGDGDGTVDWLVGGPGYADWSGAAWLFRGVGM